MIFNAARTLHSRLKTQDWKPKTQRLLTRLLLGFALISIGFAAGKHAARTGGKGEAVADITDGSGNAEPSAVVVYYMHATFRCVTCNTIERMTRELLDTEFADEITAGSVRMDGFAGQWEDLVERWCAQRDTRAQMLEAEAEERERGYARS